MTQDRPWRLTRQAEAALADVADWTLRTFGARQADACSEDLIDRCAAVARGDAQSRRCRDAFDAALDERLRFVRCGGHFIVFIEREDMMIVVDVLHARSDVPNRLGGGLRDED